MAVSIQTIVGTAEELHALAMPAEGEATHLWVLRPHRPSLVMGSAQRANHFDVAHLDRDGVELAPRRSGGGAVFIDPASMLWIDVLAPRTSGLWSVDLGETFLRTGAVWQAALQTSGVDAAMFTAPPAKSDAARLACWAGLGWGELTVAGSKVLGLSQRRTRWGARVQAMFVVDASVLRVADYLPLESQPAVRSAISTDHVAPLERAAVRLDVLEAAVIAGFEELA